MIFLSCFLSASAISVSTVFCLSTGFDIPVDGKALALLCLIFSIAWSGVFSLKRSVYGIVPTLFVLAVLVWRYRMDVFMGLSLTVERISTIYALGFDGVFYPISIARSSPDSTATAFLAVIGCWIALVASETVAHSQRLWQLALLCLPLLSLCLVVLQTTPEPWALYLFIGGFLLLILSQPIRRLSGSAGARQFMQLLLPVTAFVVLVSFIVSPEKHTRFNWADWLQSEVTAKIESLTERITGQEDAAVETISEALGLSDLYVQSEDLSALGPRARNSSPAMNIKVTKSGTYYLKGYSLGKYEGNEWTQLSAEEYGNLPFDTAYYGAERLAERVSVQTFTQRTVCYLPQVPAAVPAGGAVVYDSYVQNSLGLMEYSVAFGDSYSSASDILSTEYESFVFDKYTQLPTETRSAMADIASQFDMNMSIADRARAVADFVRQSAVYDLNTPRMDGEGDFTAWFLNESDRGYCVHFATATAVLLRCLDIPSRYVSGYMVAADADILTLVTENDAHAWAEYYLPGVGWQVLESTPGAEQSSAIPESDNESVAPTPAPTAAEGSQADLASDTVPEQKAGASEGKSARPVVAFIVLMLAAAVLVVRARYLRNKRQKAMEHGDNNSRAIAVYRYMQLLARFDGQKMDKTSQSLVEKARFSSHTLTEAELGELLTACKKREAELRSKAKLHQKLKYGLFYGI